MKPQVSILMPVYNGERYLDEAIQSIIAQSFFDLELIVINDQSTDNSKAMAEEWSRRDVRICVIDNTYSKGLPGALNSGIDASRGEYIARADSDDINDPERLAVQIKFLEKHADIDIIAGGYQLFGSTSNRKIFHPSNSVRLLWRFISNTYFCHPTVMFRRSVLQTVPYYPETACEDFAFFSKILKQHKGYNIPKILIQYREHGVNYSQIKKDSINASVMETYKKNYLFYTRSLEAVEIFYNFHSKYDLNIANVSIILKKSLTIAKKISRQYDSKRTAARYTYLLGIMLTAIIVALGHHYIMRIYRKVKIKN